MVTSHTNGVANPAAQSLSRRRFLEAAAGAAGGLLVTWSWTGATAAPIASDTPVSTELALAAQAARRTPPTDVKAYLKINPDSSVTLMTGKVEYGQGIETGFMQLVADELDVPFDNVHVIMGITDQTPYDIGTFGSLSTRTTGPIIRQAAATMRQWLLQLGADALGAPASQLATKDGAVIVTANPTKSIPFGKLAGGKTITRSIDKKAPVKQPSEFKYIGQSIPRVDVPHKVNGTQKYGYDMTVPGMVHARIVRPPSLDATLTTIDFSEAEKMPGVVGTYRDGNFAGLAAERYEQATRALAKVKATWNWPKTGHTSDNIFDLIKQTARPGQVMDKQPGNPDAGLASSSRKTSSLFRAPYVSHEPIEPTQALADVKPDKVQIWMSTQDPWSAQADVAALLKRPLESVVVTPMMSGGAFGRKSHTDPALEAARLSAALGRPVRVNRTREEEFQLDLFRPAMQVEIEAGLDSQGNVAGWKYDMWSTDYYPEGAKDPMFSAASAGIDAKDIYDLPNARTTWHQGDSPFPVAPWRANGASANALARESVIDELAAMAGVDPVTFRARLMTQNPRMLAVMKAAVKLANWKPGVGVTGQGVGIGLCVADNSYVAEIAHVTVDKTTGQIHLTHVDAAFDCGLVVNPDAVKYQIEGAIVLSASPTLSEAITFANGQVTNPTWNQYHPLRLKDVPTVDVVLVDNPTQPMAGVGEPAVPALPAAVSNAVYDAIGIRLREMPFTPDKVLAALKTT